MPLSAVPYSPAVKAGNLLFISGQIAIVDNEFPGGDFETQTKQSLANLSKVLADNGASVTDIVKTTVFLTDVSYFEPMNEIYADWAGDHRPARSTVVVSALPRGAVFEIEAVAHVG